MLSKEMNRWSLTPSNKIIQTLNKQIMKTQNTHFLQTLGEAQLQNLVKEVKETVAVNVPQVNQKNAFGVVDLWNLERSRKTRVARRHFA